MIKLGLRMSLSYNWGEIISCDTVIYFFNNVQNQSDNKKVVLKTLPPITSKVTEQLETTIASKFSSVFLWISKELGKASPFRAYITPVCMQVRKQQLELDMEQQTGSK